MPNAIPKHVAVIMDGNGRWAKQRHLPRIAGHKVGLEAARKTVRHCAEKGVGVLTLFAFSSENWRRPEEEVGFLMELLLLSLEREVKMLHENKVQLRFIGDRSNFSDKLRHKIHEVERLTADNPGMVLIIAADYGGQWDITQSVQKLAREVQAGQLAPEDVTAENIAAGLSFADLPDPDLFIRTSGEIRISNFMLWQLSYSELYFTDIFWPDFDANELDKAFAQFAQRERRYGFSGEQLAAGV